MITSCLLFIIKMISGANTRWVGCVPETRQRIYFANHTSHLDAITLWTALPPEVRKSTRPIAAKEYWESSAIRHWMAAKVFNSIFIDRTKVTAHNNPIDLILRGMGTSNSVIIFPEGGRGSGDEIRPFKSGLYHLAKEKPEVELIPVYIDNMNRILPKGEFLPIPLLSSINFGAGLFLLPNETKPHFLGRAREAILNLRES